MSSKQGQRTANPRWLRSYPINYSILFFINDSIMFTFKYDNYEYEFVNIII